MGRRPNPHTSRRPAPSREERRARAVRGVVFIGRLFEYACRDLEVSLGQYRLLLFLRHGPQRAGELAAKASITRPALSTQYAGLEKQGLIRRSEVSADRRGVRLELTRKGLSTIAEVEDRFGAVLDDATKGCDRERLLDALNEVTRALTHDIDKRVDADAFEDGSAD